MKTLSIIGSTGSIGNSALKVYFKNKNKFFLHSIGAHSNIKKLLIQSKKFKPKKIILFNNNKYKNKKILNLDTFIKKQNKKIDYIISGISGYDALEINLKLTKISKNLLIANKETIICGGPIFLNLAKKNKCKIIPIDSEHHCIDFFLNNFYLSKKIKKIYLTASGGPFLNKKINYKSSVKQALKHPTWKMGKKISIDSSTMANKVLELFEAFFLFKINNKSLDIKIEKTSKIHAIIQLNNNIFLPIMHEPSMILPIANSLNISNDCNFKFKNLILDIRDPNLKKFPLINLGKKIMNKYGHSGMILFTVLNERLVKMFLNNEIYYGDITKFLVNIFSKKKVIKKKKKKIKNIKEIREAINFAKKINI